jgi:hypothetical protein
VMARAQKPYFVFRQNGRVHLNRRGRQFIRLPASEVCASAVVMLDTPCEAYWLPTPFASFPSRASPCAIAFQLDSTWHLMHSRILSNQSGPVSRLASGSVCKAARVGVAVIPKNKMAISVRGSGSCAIIRLTTVDVYCILSVCSCKQQDSVCSISCLTGSGQQDNTRHKNANVHKRRAPTGVSNTRS